MPYDMVARYPTLSKPIKWGPVHASFAFADHIDEKLVSNVSMVPCAGDDYIIFQVEGGMWELPGGTLEPGEHYWDGLKREAMEELGGELVSYTIFGQFNCESKAPTPYKEHIPHPNFVRLMGYGEVRLTGKPSNPPGGEQVVAVEIVGIEEAVRRFESVGRSDIAELYRLADAIRRQTEENKDGDIL